MARPAVLPLIADLVVRDPKARIEDVLKECAVSYIEVVGHDMQVILDI
jgi:hypothetical protein